MKQKIIIGIAFVLLVASFFVFDLQAYFSLEYLKSQQEALGGLFERHPLLIAAGFFLVYVLVTALGLPAAAILTIAGGALFGFWLGLILVSFASSLGALAAFLLTRFLFRDQIQQRFGDKLSVINKGVEKEGAFYVFGLRLVPLFPFFMVNALLALTPIKAGTYYWTSQIGMLIGTAVYVNAGTQLAQIESTADILSPALFVSFVLLGIFPIIAKYFLNFLTQRTQR